MGISLDVDTYVAVPCLEKLDFRVVSLDSIVLGLYWMIVYSLQVKPTTVCVHLFLT